MWVYQDTQRVRLRPVKMNRVELLAVVFIITVMNFLLNYTPEWLFSFIILLLI